MTKKYFISVLHKNPNKYEKLPVSRKDSYSFGTSKDCDVVLPQRKLEKGHYIFDIHCSIFYDSNTKMWKIKKENLNAHLLINEESYKESIIDLEKPRIFRIGKTTFQIVKNRDSKKEYQSSKGNKHIKKSKKSDPQTKLNQEENENKKLKVTNVAHLAIQNHHKKDLEVNLSNQLNAIPKTTQSIDTKSSEFEEQFSDTIPEIVNTDQMININNFSSTNGTSVNPNEDKIEEKLFQKVDSSNSSTQKTSENVSTDIEMIEDNLNEKTKNVSISKITQNNTSNNNSSRYSEFPSDSEIDCDDGKITLSLKRKISREMSSNKRQKFNEDIVDTLDTNDPSINSSHQHVNKSIIETSIQVENHGAIPMEIDEKLKTSDADLDELNISIENSSSKSNLIPISITKIPKKKFDTQESKLTNSPMTIEHTVNQNMETHKLSEKSLISNQDKNTQTSKTVTFEMDMSEELKKKYNNLKENLSKVRWERDLAFKTIKDMRVLFEKFDKQINEKSSYLFDDSTSNDQNQQIKQNSNQNIHQNYNNNQTVPHQNWNSSIPQSRTDLFNDKPVSQPVSQQIEQYNQYYPNQMQLQQNFNKNVSIPERDRNSNIDSKTQLPHQISHQRAYNSNKDHTQHNYPITPKNITYNNDYQYRTRNENLYPPNYHQNIPSNPTFKRPNQNTSQQFDRDLIYSSQIIRERRSYYRS